MPRRMFNGWDEELLEFFLEWTYTLSGKRQNLHRNHIFTWIIHPGICGTHVSHMRLACTSVVESD
ncbi:hypothetical protein PROFUN_03466 [Planoprotostelium fungivorum]|uniref:Uncharacterized protein n=1 Tax=Planoprotostelium fungivorum TaxID=1890364 RepID=A0A2P6MN95_9EUKA|nr:hypothetical protein PROFUN_03466 [Planoprotostelium fungivorum]